MSTEEANNAAEKERKISEVKSNLFNIFPFFGLCTYLLPLSFQKAFSSGLSMKGFTEEMGFVQNSKKKQLN